MTLAFRLPLHVSAPLNHSLYSIIWPVVAVYPRVHACFSLFVSCEKKNSLVSVFRGELWVSVDDVYHPTTPSYVHIRGGGPAPFTTCVLGYPSQRLFMKKMSHYYMQSAKNPAHLLPKNFALHVWKQNLEYPERQVVQCVPIPYYIPTMVCTNGILVLQLIYSNMQFCTNRKLHNTHTVALKAICFPRI